MTDPHIREEEEKKKNQIQWIEMGERISKDKVIQEQKVTFSLKNIRSDFAVVFQYFHYFPISKCQY